MPATFEKNPFLDDLDEFFDKVILAIKIKAATDAQILENYAKINRVWTDRSNRARQSIKGTYNLTDEQLEIIVAHGVSYGYYLEVLHEGKYAIMKNTVAAKGPEIMAGFNDLFNKIGDLL